MNKTIRKICNAIIWIVGFLGNLTVALFIISMAVFLPIPLMLLIYPALAYRFLMLGYALFITWVVFKSLTYNFMEWIDALLVNPLNRYIRQKQKQKEERQQKRNELHERK